MWARLSTNDFASEFRSGVGVLSLTILYGTQPSFWIAIRWKLRANVMFSWMLITHHGIIWIFFGFCVGTHVPNSPDGLLNLIGNWLHVYNNIVIFPIFKCFLFLVLLESVALMFVHLHHNNHWVDVSAFCLLVISIAHANADVQHAQCTSKIILKEWIYYMHVQYTINTFIGLPPIPSRFIISTRIHVKKQNTTNN